MFRSSAHRLGLAVVAGALLAVLAASTAQAHVVKSFGKYSVALGWVAEPTYVGQLNAVQVVIKDSAGKPVTDLADGDLKVIVSIAGTQSAALALLNKFDPDTGLGVAGDYEAPLTPTVPGDYTFHLMGTIDGQAVDETATSGDDTFNSAIEATDIQFPTKLPSLADISTRLDRIDARLAAIPAPAPTTAPASAAPSSPANGLVDEVAAAQAAAAQAHDAASNALLVGAGIGGLGVIVGLIALAMALRGRSRA